MSNRSYIVVGLVASALVVLAALLGGYAYSTRAESEEAVPPQTHVDPVIGYHNEAKTFAALPPVASVLPLTCGASPFFSTTSPNTENVLPAPVHSPARARPSQRAQPQRGQA